MGAVEQAGKHVKRNCIALQPKLDQLVMAYVGFSRPTDFVSPSNVQVALASRGRPFKVVAVPQQEKDSCGSAVRTSCVS